MVFEFAAGMLLTGMLTLAWPRWLAAAPRRGSAEWARSRRVFAVVAVLASASAAAGGDPSRAGTLLAFGLGSLIGLELAGRWQERDARHHEG